MNRRGMSWNRGSMYSLKRLRLLREVSTRGSLAAAAAALGQDPSSVSHQLKALEAEVGAPLLERVGRGVRLTEEALILVTRTEAVLSELEAAEAEIAAARHEVSGTVRIAAFQTALHTIVPGALARLNRDHPDLTVETTHIRAEDGIPSLLSRDFDLVIEENYPSRPARRAEGVETETLGDDELCLITPAAGRELAASGPSLAECAHHSWAMEPADTHAGHWSRAECRRAGFEPDVTTESSDVVFLVRLVASGLASALVPRLALHAAAMSTGTEPTEVAIGRLPEPANRRISTAIRRGSARTPRIIALRDALRAKFFRP
ncbi:LysR family transcriptional regulator [Brevibacterium sp. SMBL_HHYL_HB1]|uniref:LysR family transcriptional regulator n=1 Tax=Brevibacterium sp. SMBL_HHYL_HB1 TaxID=2777556 RepID=UPI001BAB7250|nr:LysR family transcriptional regulator [Brevibacterium sp. SMBL_HHYL_HB1]